ncbi:MAG: aspartate kinase [Oceanotoga sp.]|uniref:aspartate kinase n=1 Tax=Oceanotoga sp. TaxID=2108366 RepID=UPI00264F9AB2|nr:aspartate kinase [Oceanotoga sp.]MDN5342678.1 aspartate kinase [Oceanotoga sp.]
MNIIVQKYGGSSVADSEKIKQIAKKIKEKIKENNKLIIVVSAMGKTTDNLLKLSKEISKKPNLRELDMLLTTGEQISASLLSIALNEIKIKAKSLNAYQAGIYTNNEYNHAKIEKFDTKNILNHLENYQVLVITGFQGINQNGDLTTLGRGGSDTSAVALASSLNAKCEIYSDYPGIYTIDPKLYPNAKKIKKVNYDEMLEMSRLGSKVLHYRSVEIAKKYKTIIYCGATFSEEEGSYIMPGIEDSVVTGLSVDRGQTQVNIINLPINYSLINEIFKITTEKSFNVDMISIINANDKINVSFSIVENDKADMDEFLKTHLKEFKDVKLSYRYNLTKISVVGVGMRSSKGVAMRFFKSLDKIPITLVTTSEIKISALIDETNLSKAIKNIAEEFSL